MQQEARGSCRVSIREKGLPLSYEGKVGIPLESKQRNQPPSQDDVGNMVSCGGKFGVPLK